MKEREREKERGTHNSYMASTPAIIIIIFKISVKAKPLTPNERRILQRLFNPLHKYLERNKLAIIWKTTYIEPLQWALHDIL